MPKSEPTTDSEPEPEIDEELLAEAMRGAATCSRNEAVNAALRHYVEAKRARRREALAEVRRMADDGAFDFARLEELDQFKPCLWLTSSLPPLPSGSSWKSCMRTATSRPWPDSFRSCASGG
jgi:Arc/MetJ family transcription regulator